MGSMSLGPLGLGLTSPLVGARGAPPLFVFSPSFSSSVSLTRASTGTFHGSNGRIQTAAIDAPRYEYDPVTLALKGLLREPTAITNILLSSGVMGSADWTTNFVTRTANATVAPDGTTTAALIVPTSGSATRALKQTLALTAVPTLFVFRAKAAGFNFGLFSISGNPNTFVWFNLATGAVGTIGSATGASCRITLESDGFYRCEVLMTPTANASSVVFFGCASTDGVSATTGDTVSGIYMWGAEIKPGASFGDSYIPTTTVAVTRAADVLSLNVAADIEALTYSFGDGTSQPSRVLTPGPAFQVPVLSNNVLVSASQYAMAQRTSYVGGQTTPLFLNGPVNTVTSLASSYNNRSRHKTQVDLISMQVILPNWAVSLADTPPLTEFGPGYAIAEAASVEYPLGTIIGRFTFSGASSVVIPDGGEVLTDEIALTAKIPAGAFYFIRRYAVGDGLRGTNTAYKMSLGFPSSDTGNSEFSIINADTASSDATGTTGTPAGSNASYRRPPLAILGRTNARTVVGLGDSRMEGAQDSYVGGGTSGDLGEIFRSLGPNYAYINMGVGNDRADRFIASHSYRLAAALYASDVVIGYGVNDIASGGRTAAQVLADAATIRGYFPGGTNFYMFTLPPFGVTGTYTTLGGQTVSTGLETQRQAYNTALRAGIAGVTIWDIAPVVEDASNPGKWKVDQGAMTTDGTHENQAACLRIAASGIIQLAP